jgi:hypothetical protein
LITEWKSPIPFSAAGFNYGVLYGGTEKATGLTIYTPAPPLYVEEKRNNEAQQQPGQQGINEAAMRTNQCYNLHPPRATVGQAARLFQSFYGPLTFHAFSVAALPAPRWGGSLPMSIVVPFDPLEDQATLLCFNETERRGRKFYDLPAVREIARQWWGSQTGGKTYHDDWLFLGLAEFSEALYVREFKPNEWDDFWDAEMNLLLTKGKDGRRPVDVGPVWLNYQTRSREDPQVVRVLVHQKGAYIFQMLRLLMQDPKSQNPDAGFMAMVQDFAKTYAGQNASTADFQKIVEKHMARPMDWFFDEWVYGTEMPHYDFSYQLSDAGGGKTLLTMALKQSEVSNSFVMEVPIYAELKKKVFRLGLIRMQGSTAQNGELTLAFRPDRIILDADHSVLGTISQ